ncbi:MAG TPA: isoaspartyl peptidase/L-asparaginase, partial [Allosphingosinicella sp.]
MRSLIIFGALLMSTAAQAADWKLVIHGGAGVMERGRMTAGQERDIRAALDRALATGSDIL